MGAIAPPLEKAEIERAKREPTHDPAAYDLYLRGLDRWNLCSKSGNMAASLLFRAAIDKDPEFAAPYGLAASCYQFAKANGWGSEFLKSQGFAAGSLAASRGQRRYPWSAVSPPIPGISRAVESSSTGKAT